MDLSSAAALAAVAISVFSLILREIDRQRSEKASVIKAQQAEEASVIKALQGERRSIGYEAYRITVSGWPSQEERRSQLRDALCLAGVFESSDRTRAMIYSALRLHPEGEKQHIMDVLRRIQMMFTEFGDQLELKRGQDRLVGLCRALGIDPASIGSAAPPEKKSG
jgi:ABC-type phosphate/phosphonate transport system ATPase subunit